MKSLNRSVIYNWKLIFLAALVLLSLYCSAIKQTTDHKSGGVFGKILVSRFGLAEGGLIEVDYDVSAQHEDQPYESYMLINIMTNAERNNWYYQLDDSESTIKANINSLCSQPAILRRVVYGKGKLSLRVDSSIGRDRFSVALLQCRDGSNGNPVRADITVEMRNPRPDSDDGYSHLAIEDVMVVRVVEGELIIYSLFILGLIGQIVVGKQHVSELHWLFLTVLFAVMMFMVVQYYNFFRYNQEGTANENLESAVSSLRAITTTLILASLLILSLGWSLVRSAGSITYKELRVVGTIISIFFVFAMFDALCSGDSTVCNGIGLVTFILRSLILLCVIVAVNFTAAQLRSMLLHSPWVPSTPLQYARLRQYQMFRIVFVLYLILPTIFIIIRGVMFTWKEDWIVFMLNELLDIMVFFHVGVTFSPLHDRLLTRAFDGTVTQAIANEAEAH